MSLPVTSHDQTIQHLPPSTPQSQCLSQRHEPEHKPAEASAAAAAASSSSPAAAPVQSLKTMERKAKAQDDDMNKWHAQMRELLELSEESCGYARLEREGLLDP